MSESGERDGKKSTPRAEVISPAAARPAGKSIWPSTAIDPDDLAGWDDTTTVHRPLDMLVADEPTAVHHAADVALAAQAADRAVTEQASAVSTRPQLLDRPPPSPGAPEAARQDALLPPKPTVPPPQSAFPLPAPPSAPSLGAAPLAPPAPARRDVGGGPLPQTISSGVEMGRPIFAVAAVGLLAAGAAWLTGARATAIGVLIGAGFATLNLWAFTRLGRGLSGQRGAAWGLLAAAKLLLLFGGTFWVLAARISPPVPFLVGYLALPVGIVLSQVLGLKSEFEDGEGSI